MADYPLAVLFLADDGSQLDVQRIESLLKGLCDVATTPEDGCQITAFSAVIVDLSAASALVEAVVAQAKGAGVPVLGLYQPDCMVTGCFCPVPSKQCAEAHLKGVERGAFADDHELQETIVRFLNALMPRSSRQEPPSNKRLWYQRWRELQRSRST